MDLGKKRHVLSIEMRPEDRSRLDEVSKIVNTNKSLAMRMALKHYYEYLKAHQRGV
jgi:predicted transcriptional regulator